MKGINLAWFVSLLLLALLGTKCRRPKDASPVIAVVGEEALTLNELIDKIPNHIRADMTSVNLREFVLSWINDQVLYQEAVAREIDRDETLRKEFENLKRELVISKLLEQTLNKDIAVAEEEMKAYYDANREGFILSDDVVHAHHVLLGSQKEANEVRKRLRAGEPFGTVAQDITQDSLEADAWDLGYFSRNDVIEEIAKVVFKMSVKSISYPIKSDFGYHIVQLVDKQKKGEVESFDTVKDEIKQKLLTRKRQDKYQRFVLQMKSKFKIQTNFLLLDSSILDSLLYEVDRAAL
ncbi:peptidyl-prolyl cis-trans isomerase [candidate division KSB1 bacterium]|nr:peptidyl-prolyl cis-trans isomerase [candidate division KSB1 bacterium]